MENATEWLWASGAVSVLLIAWLALMRRVPENANLRVAVQVGLFVSVWMFIMVALVPSPTPGETPNLDEPMLSPIIP